MGENGRDGQASCSMRPCEAGYPRATLLAFYLHVWVHPSSRSMGKPLIWLYDMYTE